MLQFLDRCLELLLVVGVPVPQQAQPQRERGDPQRRTVVQPALQVAAGRPLPLRGLPQARAVVREGGLDLGGDRGAEHDRRGVEGHGASLAPAPGRTQRVAPRWR